MNICSVCLKCYDDSIAICSVDNKHGTLTPHRQCKGLAFGDYQIESRFESVSPVELFRATHSSSGTNVLIRFISKDECLFDPEEELRAASDVEHPALLSILEFGNVDSNELFVAFEDITGQSLFGVLDNSKTLPELDAISIVRQVAEALEALHSVGLIHKSVSPANIYLTSSNESVAAVLLADFGGKVKNLPQLAATPAGFDPLIYRAPEQFSNEKADYGTDLYSLAAVFYELLLGRRHIDAGNAETARSFVFSESDVWDLHHELRALIAHVLRQSFQKRTDLRTPSTNNFVRQMRYIELIAKRLAENPDKKREHETEYSSTVVAASRQIGLIDDVSAKLVPPVSEETSRKEQVSLPETQYIPGADEVVFEDSGIVEAPAPLSVVPAVQPGARIASGFSRKSMYAVGLLCAALVGGIVTAGFYDWQGGSSSAQRSTIVQTQTQQEQMPEIENKESQNQIIEEDETPYLLDDRDRELDQVVSLVSAPLSKKKNASAPLKKKPVRAKPRKKRKSTRRNKGTNIASKEPASTRPRFVKDIIIYY